MKLERQTKMTSSESKLVESLDKQLIEAATSIGLDPKEVVAKYAQHEISLEICRLYANGNCPHCLNRGYLTYSFPEFDKNLHETVNVVSWGDYCVCVKKNLKKKRVGRTPRTPLN